MSTTTVSAEADTAEQAPKRTIGQRAMNAAKAKGKQTAHDAALRARKDARSVVHRNRRQLAPVALAGGYGAVGAAGDLISYAPEVSNLAASGGSGATALAASWLAWRYYSDHVPKWARYRAKLGAAFGFAWCSVTPIIGADQPSMWLGLTGAAVALAARYWQRIRPDNPDGPPEATPQHTPTPEPEPMPDQVDVAGEADTIMQRYNERVASPRGVLKSSEIKSPRYGETTIDFDVDLVPGEQDIDTARAAVPKVASALEDYPRERITFVPGKTERNVVLRVVTNTPSGEYDGPRIHETDGDVHIELGPYIDGDGVEQFHLMSDQDKDNPQEGSVNSGFVLGSKGSGKSRFLETVAIALRKLGIEIWYLDPQGGASSDALRKQADWPLMTLHDEENREYGNVLKLLDAMNGVVDIRQTEQSASGDIGFKHTRERPAIMVIIDECHQVFNAVNPRTNAKFGDEFGDLDRVMRKLGMGILAGSQTYVLPTFGGCGSLRDGLVAGNLHLMRMKDPSQAGLLPSNSPRPEKLPDGGGFGFNPEGRRPQDMWRTRNIRNQESWMAAYPSSTLDRRATKAAGQAYLERFQAAKKHTAEMQARLDAFDTQDKPLQHGKLGGASVSSQSNSGGRGASSRIPDRPSASVTPIHGGGGELEGVKRQIVDLLNDHDELSTNELAQSINTSPQTIRTHLRPLEDDGWLVPSGRGRYRRA